MKRKYNPRPRQTAAAPQHSDVDAEKKVARFMTKFFGVSLTVIVVFLVYLWWIGKFG